MFNLNIGLLGHVDSGKTSLAKAISEVASTAAFDKNPQSKERGITLDLGFSSFYIPTPAHLLNKLTNINKIQLTLVDCPGHASLIKTIIGGAQIIDLILLVIDITKGIQTQTGECLILAQICCKNIIVILNKIDLLEETRRHHLIEKMKKRVTYTLETLGFVSVPIIDVSANPGELRKPIGLDNLIQQISTSIFIPKRNITDPCVFAVDHCFAIKGKGTILTGTILQGSVKIDDMIELPSLSLKKKLNQFKCSSNL